MTTGEGTSAKGRLKVVLGTQGQLDDQSFERVLGLDAFAALIRSPAFLGQIGRYREVIAVAPHSDAIPRPLAVSACLRLLSRSACRIDSSAAMGSQMSRDITWRSCFGLARRMIRDRRDAPRMLDGVNALLDELERSAQTATLPVSRNGPVLHVRSDLWLGVKAGGAVAHTAGIVNAFASLGMAPTALAYEHNPVIAPAVTQKLLALPRRFWDMPELPAAAANADVLSELDACIQSLSPALIYHRLSAFGFVAALAARRRGIPLIVEYNGSEAWIARHWGRAFRNEAFALRAERAVLGAADRIATVSSALRDELIERGLPRERIRVVMNGVDCQRFHPMLDGLPARARFGISRDQVVIGFIGSFGVWHGVPLLVEAWARVLESASHVRGRVVLLLIGDGGERPAVEARVAQLGCSDSIRFTGLVPQAEAPGTLAAADILVAPHIPNPDGSTFFGSPTKLFEYMAMGRCIVASRLAQIADVLTDRCTALLVEPGNAGELASALLMAIDDAKLRARLGGQARATAVAEHDWTRRVIALID